MRGGVFTINEYIKQRIPSASLDAEVKGILCVESWSVHDKKFGCLYGTNIFMELILLTMRRNGN